MAGVRRRCGTCKHCVADPHTTPPSYSCVAKLPMYVPTVYIDNRVERDWEATHCALYRKL